MTKKSKEKYPDTQRVLTVMTVVEKSGNVNAPVNKYCTLIKTAKGTLRYCDN